MCVVWPRELKDCRGTPDDGGVQSIWTVGTQHREDREAFVRESTDTTDQRVDTGAISMVHLGQFARLGQSIGIVEQEDQAMMVMPEFTREAAR